MLQSLQRPWMNWESSTPAERIRPISGSCPNQMSSWEFFDYLLHQIAVVGTPGEGFGKNGEGWFRLTAFGDRDKTIEAMQRTKQLLQK